MRMVCQLYHQMRNQRNERFIFHVLISNPSDASVLALIAPPRRGVYTLSALISQYASESAAGLLSTTACREASGRESVRCTNNSQTHSPRRCPNHSPTCSRLHRQSCPEENMKYKYWGRDGVGMAWVCTQ